MDSLDKPPTYDKLAAIMEKMKWGKAGGRTGNLPDTLWRPRITVKIVETNERGVEGRICSSGLEEC